MKRKLSAITATLIVIAMLVTGTFAWVNFQQNVTNEWSDEGKPGGTTHDDFDKPKKEVYIENWGKMPIFVRIRLDEYMEIGDGAGSKGTFNGTTWVPNSNNKSTSVLPGANINDKTTWKPHIPAADDPCICHPTPLSAGMTHDFHYFWKWTMGGQKYYRSVLNYADERYKELDYVDQNIIDYTNSSTFVKLTRNAEVITMAEWRSRGFPIGDYWVVDADGWCYWAAPLAPGDATGLLISMVELVKDPEDSYYYAINVIAQMATKNGDQNYTDFFNNFDKDHTATDDGEELLEIITGNKDPNRIAAESVSIIGSHTINMQVGDEITLNANISPSNSTDSKVWKSEDSTVASVTNVNTNGLVKALKVGTTKITVTAGDKTDEVTVIVTAATKPATKIEIRGGNRDKTVGQKEQLFYDVTPTDTTDTITWQSSNTNAVTVTSGGYIEAVGVGTARITIRAGGVSHYIDVTVKAPAEGIEIKGGDRAMIVGQKEQLEYNVAPPYTTDTITWESSNTNAVTVTAGGYIEAVGVGTARITIKAGTVFHYIDVTVSPAVDPLIDLKGDGTYDTTHNDGESEADQAKNYALRCLTVGGESIPDENDQDGSIKLSTILAGTDYSYLGVIAEESAMSQWFKIGTDKDGSPALIYTYIPPASVWNSLAPDTYPIITVNLLLTKPGYTNTPIKITMRYDGSLRF